MPRGGDEGLVPVFWSGGTGVAGDRLTLYEPLTAKHPTHLDGAPPPYFTVLVVILIRSVYLTSREGSS